MGWHRGETLHRCPTPAPNGRKGSHGRGRNSSGELATQDEPLPGPQRAGSVAAVQLRNGRLLERLAPPLLHARTALGFKLAEAIVVKFAVGLEPARRAALLVASLDVLGGGAGRERRRRAERAAERFGSWQSVMGR